MLQEMLEGRHRPGLECAPSQLHPAEVPRPCSPRGRPKCCRTSKLASSCIQFSATAKSSTGTVAPDEDASFLEQVCLSKASIFPRAYGGRAGQLLQNLGSLRAPGSSAFCNKWLEMHVLGCAKLCCSQMLSLHLCVGRGSCSRNVACFCKGIQPLEGRDGNVKCSWSPVESRHEDVSRPPMASLVVIRLVDAGGGGEGQVFPFQAEALPAQPTMQ